MHARSDYCQTHEIVSTRVVHILLLEHAVVVVCLLMRAAPWRLGKCRDCVHAWCLCAPSMVIFFRIFFFALAIGSKIILVTFLTA